MCDRTIIDALHAFLRLRGSSFTDSHGIFLALSGGMDSIVLMHALKHENIPFSACHINHGLSPHANKWVDFVTQQCNALSVPITCMTLNSRPVAGESIEAWARNERYAAFIDALPENSVLLTAHHEHDQAETLLLQLMRGAGPKGLSGIAPNKWLCRQKNIQLYRPLLTVSHQSIMAYAKKHALTWVEDESNAQLRFDRNFMRHQALPLLASRMPHVVKSVSQSAAYLQEQQAVLDILIAEKMPDLKGSVPGTLSIARLLTLPDILLRAVLRHWIAENHVRMPSALKLESIVTSVLKASQDAQPHVCIDDHAVVRYRDTLYIVSQDKLRSLRGYRFEWDPRETLVLPYGAGVVCWNDLKNVGLDVAPGEKVIVQFRQGGENVYVPGVGHQPLKKWFQTHDIPIWQRDRVPLIGTKTVLPLLI